MTNSIDTTSLPVGTVINKDGTTTKASGSGSTLDKDSFLKLLVAQLKYQDPMSPTDSTQFMQQSAQFSELEALQNMQKDTTSLLNSTQAVSATGMLGKKITALPTATGGADIVGVVTGVKLGTDGPVLKIGEMEVPLSSVKEVSQS